MRVALSLVALLLCAPLFSATLEQLSTDQMAQQATLIVRGRITGCAGEMPRFVIYTRCSVLVTETWKGAPVSKVDFVVPGGTARGLSQTFSGAPRFSENQQFVLFLWVGKSGIPQIIGLSQGVFGVALSPTGEAIVKRQASTEVMLDSKGKEVQDETLVLSVTQLRREVARALARGQAK